MFRVPILGMPIFADQSDNAATILICLENRQKLEKYFATYVSCTFELLFIKKITNNPKIVNQEV